jgi:hypothetical protein
VRIRREVLAAVGDPVVMETHCGFGAVYDRCYRGLRFGVAIEKQEDRARAAALRRPAWAVYEGDCVAMLGAGLAADVPVNVLDVDPYGDPWPAVRAFLASRPPPPGPLHVVVNDGLRNYVKLGKAWTSLSLRPIVERRGGDLYDVYLEVCRELMGRIAGEHGYRLAGWEGYYCGKLRNMTHYAARLER